MAIFHRDRGRQFLSLDLLESLDLDYENYHVETDFSTYLKIFECNDNWTLSNKVRSVSEGVILKYVIISFGFYDIDYSEDYFFHPIVFSKEGITIILPEKKSRGIIPPRRTYTFYRSPKHPFNIDMNKRTLLLHSEKIKYVRDQCITFNFLKGCIPTIWWEVNTKDIISRSSIGSRLIIKKYIEEFDKVCLIKMIPYMSNDMRDVISEVHELYFSLNFVNKSSSKYMVKLLAFDLNMRIPYNIFTNIKIGKGKMLCKVYEYVKGVGLKQFVEKCGIVMMNTVLLQLFYTLKELYTFKFTHYDLNLHNILVETLTDVIRITYGNKNIRSNRMVRLIDYETCYHGSIGAELRSDDGHSTDDSSEEFKPVFYPDCNIHGKYYWIHDIFKCLMYLYKYTNCTLIAKSIKSEMFDGNVIRQGTRGEVDEQINRKILKLDADKFNIKNSIISKLLSFFCGGNMTVTMFKEYEKINSHFSLPYRDYDLDFNNFIRHAEKILEADYSMLER